MSDIKTVNRLIDDANGEVITDLCARIIASLWHGGQSSPLYALSSTGAIVHGIEMEITTDLIADLDDETVRMLNALIEYVSFHGYRPMQDGWSNLHW